jgi:hypothetical protein
MPGSTQQIRSRAAYVPPEPQLPAFALDRAGLLAYLQSPDRDPEMEDALKDFKLVYLWFYVCVTSAGSMTEARLRKKMVGQLSYPDFDWSSGNIQAVFEVMAPVFLRPEIAMAIHIATMAECAMDPVMQTLAAQMPWTRMTAFKVIFDAILGNPGAPWSALMGRFPAQYGIYIHAACNKR